MLLVLLACEGTVNTKDDSTTGADSGTIPDDVEVPDLVINEFLAANTSGGTDAAGEFDDWVEIYNNGDTLVQLEGLYLTDDVTEKTRWAFPSGVGLSPGEHLIVWCDTQVDQMTGDELHTNFALEKNGEQLALFLAVDGREPIRVDGVEWAAEADDIASARVPDGSSNWVHQAPTPGDSNGR